DVEIARSRLEGRQEILMEDIRVIGERLRNELDVRLALLEAREERPKGRRIAPERLVLEDEAELSRRPRRLPLSGAATASHKGQRRERREHTPPVHRKDQPPPGLSVKGARARERESAPS